MDAFDLFNTFVSPDFASSTGITIEHITSFATSSVLSIFGYAPYVFLYHNAAQIIAYGMILGVLVVPISAFIYYKFLS